MSIWLLFGTFIGGQSKFNFCQKYHISQIVGCQSQIFRVGEKYVLIGFWNMFFCKMRGFYKVVRVVSLSLLGSFGGRNNVECSYETVPR